MIYNDKFVWLHYPKCAGTKIEILFNKYFAQDERIIQDVFGDPLDKSYSWHHSVRDRELMNPDFQLGERTVICSFRRLPSWLESRFNYELMRNPEFVHHPEILVEGKFYENNGFINHADHYARKYLPGYLLVNTVVRFLRSEYFASDFKTIFGDYLDISIIPDSELQARVNTSASKLPEEIRNRLYDENSSVYECCPYWRSVEELAYQTLY